MTEPSLPQLEIRRARLYARLAAIGDFRRGSISENYRRCGKPNCACAQPGHPGHGPRFLWTRTVAGRGMRGRQLSAAEVEKVRGELGRYQEFATLAEQIVEVSEAICEAGAGARRADPRRSDTGRLSRSGTVRTTRPPRPGHVTSQLPTFLSRTHSCPAPGPATCRL